MEKKNILVTGGAGFIGSNLVQNLLQDERVGLVRVLDNLATGNRQNLDPYLGLPNFEFVWGDIREYSTCMDVCKGMDMISHQAALGSVPRSIQHPVTTNNVNITGTLNIYTAARELGIKRIVYAASSSTYGDSKSLPKVEDVIGNPLSPYAVTKLVNELYAKVYGSLYQMEFIGLRYFNIFGPRQDPNGAYAAVIPLFVKGLLYDKAPLINGDGEQSRDFTYVANAVQANIKALFTQNSAALNQVYNIACGERISLNEMYRFLQETAHSELQPEYGPDRAGDVKHSLADISKARELLGYEPEVTVREGLRKVYGWYAEGFFHGGNVKQEIE
jgi:UDP-N-acetylglucosamine/UDP-N-acetylgalactosamine 4-epimerase